MAAPLDRPHLSCSALPLSPREGLQRRIVPLPETAQLTPVDAERTRPVQHPFARRQTMEEAIQYADDLRASNAGTQDLLGTEVHDTMMLRTAETATGKTTSGKKKKKEDVVDDDDDDDK